MPIKLPKWRKNPKSIGKFQFVYHFLPSYENNKRATLLSSSAIVVYLLLIITLMSLFRFMPKIFPGVLGYASNIEVKSLLELTNAKRQEIGLKPLILSETLSKAANDKAIHMFNNNYWAHVAPDGTEPWDFILEEGYDYVYAGENLAKNFSNSRDVVSAWYTSLSHRENLLGENYDEVGFAVLNGNLEGYETTLVVQMFGRPRNPLNIATKFDENAYLQKISTPTSKALVPEVQNISVKRAVVDLPTVSKTVSSVFVSFILLLLALDIWYSHKKGILKFTGHTYVHILFLIVILLGVWFALKPGVVM